MEEHDTDIVEEPTEENIKYDEKVRMSVICMSVCMFVCVV